MGISSFGANIGFGIKERGSITFWFLRISGFGIEEHGSIGIRRQEYRVLLLRNKWASGFGIKKHGRSNFGDEEHMGIEFCC